MKRIFHALLFVIQFSFYWIIYPFALLIYGKKRVWIICERGDDARDNGYWMFKHLASEHSYVNKYYLIKKNSVDYKKVSNLGKVVRYKSFKHWLLYCAAEVRMTTHLAAFAPGNYIGEYFKHHKQKGVNVFLQHGITHNEFPSNYYQYNGSDLFICGAEPEFNHISRNCNYPAGNVVYTGFPRFDGLHDTVTKRQILVMPSWRSYLYSCNDKSFKESLYFKTWFSLLKNADLLSYCRSNNVKIIFYPHYSMQQFVGLFSSLNNDVITVADFDHFDVQTLLKESSMLITDYSSILFDFAYMKKPQLLYQFDENDFYGKHYKKSYFDHKANGFGKVCTDEVELLSNIKKICSNNFDIDDLYCRRISQFFPIFDEKNCERVYQEIVRKFISKKKTYCPPNCLNAVVTGDDYGRNYESSEGIRQAFKNGYIQHASIILNKDEKDCLDLAKVDVNKLGLHINLTEGYQSFGDCSFYAYSVNDKSSIAYKEFNTRRAFYKLSNEAKEIIFKEVSAQIAKYEQLGLTNLVFDSHGHIHTKMPIAKIIIPILKKEGFTSTRIPANVSKKNVIKTLYNKRVACFYKKHFNTTDYFCSCDDYIHIRNYKKFNKRSIEIMTHPFIENNNLVNRRDISFDVLYRK